MAANTVPAVGERGIFGVTGDIADVAFRANTGLYVERRELRRGSRRKRQKRS
jgi:hypothetical protein